MIDQNKLEMIAENDDQNSLVDLLVVLLRFRSWIMGITAAVALLSITSFWLLPKFGILSVVPETSYTAMLTIAVVNPPELLSSYFDTNTANQTQAWFQNMSLISPLYRELIVDGNDDFGLDAFAKDGSLETHLQQEVIGKTLKVSFDEMTVSVTVTMESRELDRAKEFLAALAAAVKVQVTDVMRKRIQNAVMAIEIALTALSETTSPGALTQMREKQALLTQMVKDADYPFQQQGELVVLSQLENAGADNKAFSPIVLIFAITLGALVASGLLAFALEYVRRVRGSANDMRKIRDVLAKKAQTH